MPRYVKISEFKAKCHALIDEVARTGGAVIITRSDKPVAELVPHRPRAQSARGILEDELVVIGDTISRVDVEWNSLR